MSISEFKVNKVDAFRNIVIDLFGLMVLSNLIQELVVVYGVT